jgi:hypothetical protein
MWIVRLAFRRPYILMMMAILIATMRRRGTFLRSGFGSGRNPN